MARRMLKITAVNAAVFFVLLLFLEGGLQVIALLRPSYEVLFLQPDRALGWKQVPNLHWTWAGHHWYAADFSVAVQTNSLGFRDLDRTPAKADGLKRVAFLGDSFIEAVQVPLERTATQELERRLNAEMHSHWEVLNFGISNFGVGQYLLAWGEYAKQYKPDYVVMFVAKFIMERTVQRFEEGAFSSGKKLWVRPTFRLENSQLALVPAKDFGDFVRVQDALIASDFHGERSRRRVKFIMPSVARELWARIPWRTPRPDQAGDQPANEDTALFVDVNLKAIEVLGKQVAEQGGKLVVVDASRYFGDNPEISDALRTLCENHDFGYVPVYESLLTANRQGVPTKWRHDFHFNEAGNAILAADVFDWLTLNQ